jgi:hypothetical protein
MKYLSNFIAVIACIALNSAIVCFIANQFELSKNVAMAIAIIPCFLCMHIIERMEEYDDTPTRTH